MSICYFRELYVAAEIVVKGLVEGGLRNLEFVKVKLK
jgi:hypothetical protein